MIYFQAVTDRDSSVSAETGSDSGCGVSSSTSSLTTSPGHGTVCLRIKEGINYDILDADNVDSSCFLDEFQSRQKFMEEQNRQRKELLAKALADRSV
jgi:RAB6-interacting golgin